MREDFLAEACRRTQRTHCSANANAVPTSCVFPLDLAAPASAYPSARSASDRFATALTKFTRDVSETVSPGLPVKTRDVSQESARPTARRMGLSRPKRKADGGASDRSDEIDDMDSAGTRPGVRDGARSISGAVKENLGVVQFLLLDFYRVRLRDVPEPGIYDCFYT